MELWVISIGGTGGKVCCSAQSVQLVFGSVQQSPGRLTDERSKGCNSSCSPPCLATRRHTDMKWQLISSVVSCCDSSFVNVWTRLFKHCHLTSLWLLTFSLRASFFSFSFTDFIGFSKPHCRAHPVHTSILAYFWLPSLFLHYQFNFQKNLNNSKNKWVSAPSVLSLRHSVFSERPELLFCIVIGLLLLWWRGKLGWQLFLKPERAHSRGAFSSAVFPHPLSANNCIIPCYYSLCLPH